MIRSKEDYAFYIQADKISSGISRARPRPLVGDEIWKFQLLMRKCEYWNNCLKDRSPAHALLYSILLYRYHQMSVRLGFTIPLNVFGPGLSIAHYGQLVVGAAAEIGENCRIHPGANIGSHGTAAPKIGNNVYIGPGAKIFGAIEIADGIAIGANSVVNRSFLEPNISIAGVPARKVSDRGSLPYIVRGTEVLRGRSP
jgi:serine O-acetyltransferase